MLPSHAVDIFIARWQPSGGAERANAQAFLCELCDLLGVPRPDPQVPDDAFNAYVFERSVRFLDGDGQTREGRIDLYKRHCFVLESKQGVEAEEEARLLAAGPPRRRGVRRAGPGWDNLLRRARHQAESYVRALPADEGRPPFVLVVDVGRLIEVYAEFTRTGGNYTPYPDPRSHRITLDQLRDPAVRERLRAIWTDPLSLDPSRRSAHVTREIAGRLALLARSLEDAGHLPDSVATFLMRCLFTMFCEDVGLLPKGAFTSLLESLRDRPELFRGMVEDVWRAMKSGDFSASLRAKLLHFNGALFEDWQALEVNREQLELLVEAGRADWREVEPAIFGTLLERALSPRERHKLGAHYTPRAYVERLVIPTVIEPLRAQWQQALAAASRLDDDGDRAGAIRELRRFHAALCRIRVLDPACGSGNFLYVTLEHLKRLEGEVLDALAGLGDTQAGLEHAEGTVGPRQFRGLEVNPHAARIAELVLWIGYLQWHLRTRGAAETPEPVIGGFHNVECRDAVLAWDSTRPRLDEQGRPVTRWDGHSTKPHPVTGEEVPDETQRVLVEDYINPRPATWPEADFVVGNPPFIGKHRMREALGDGYVEALRAAHPEVPESCDYVMYWWEHAALLARQGHLRRFGFITTNSIAQTFSRRLLQRHLTGRPPLTLLYAIPDHPWVDAADGADVRIAMTVAAAAESPGTLATVVAEGPGRDHSREVRLVEHTGRLHADLTVGPPVADAVALRAAEGLCSFGMMLAGAGFIVSRETAARLGLGEIPGLERHIRPYLNGRDVAGRARGVMVIDLFGLSEEEVLARFPAVYQWLLERVKPERDAKIGRTPDADQYARSWWVFAKPRPAFRSALQGLTRFIATPETARRRYFVFLDRDTIPDHMLVNIALDDAYFLGVLSSRVHVTWTLAAGGRLGIGNDPRYNKTRCFDPFPFPDPPEALRARIRDLGERLDAHRKRRQTLHPDLTLTDMYHVLAKLRKGETLSGRERRVHDDGLVAVLQQIHDELDEAVFAAYGWDASMDDEALLGRLVALNAERATEERRGLVRWLRPEYQTAGGQPTQLALDTGDAEAAVAVAEPERRPWPATLSEQVGAVRAALVALDRPVQVDELALRFARRQTARFRADVAALLETLADLGLARRVEDGRFVRA